MFDLGLLKFLDLLQSNAGENSTTSAFHILITTGRTNRLETQNEILCFSSKMVSWPDNVFLSAKTRETHHSE